MLNLVLATVISALPAPRPATVTANGTAVAVLTPHRLVLVAESKREDKMDNSQGNTQSGSQGNTQESDQPKTDS